ncbi:MAG: carboxypeptidase-like regulatory domain-containing protein [Candidatus Scalindua sp.]|jgi:hypothetical protein|nr:carboxypeptidase-like regulatory domain-containing protein [Candidatus Scalindua sp.]MDV5166799.1 carboxypeptidase-like regulatory domain-containing protein [Candidatus Scalindua sp.]
MLSKLKIASLSLMVVGLLFCVSQATYAAKPFMPTDGGSVLVQVIALGSPIEHAEVSVGDNSDSTGHNGNRMFSVEPGNYTVSAAGPDGGSASKEVRVRPGEFIQVTLELGASGLHASGGH